MERTIEYCIPDTAAGQTIKEYTRQSIGISARLLRTIKFRPGGILVNGKHQTVRYVLVPGDILRINLEDQDDCSENLLPSDGPLDILFENDDLLLLNKPAGVVVHPSRGHWEDSLASRILTHYQKLNQSVTTRPVGRLDMDTSGLIFFAKNRFSCTDMQEQRTAGTLSRQYLALVSGCPRTSSGSITLPLSSDPDENNHYQVMPEGEGLPSRTDYKVLKQYKNYSLVLLKLHSGRTHQIRLHMSATGHPLLGDPLYGAGNAAQPGFSCIVSTQHALSKSKTAYAGTTGTAIPGLSRTALHSCRITCRLPLTEKVQTFTAAPPEDMLAYMNDFDFDSFNDYYPDSH